MRILWIKTELLHPVDKGGRIRSYQMLRELVRRHEITFLCLYDGSASPDALASAREYAHCVETVPFSPPAKGTTSFSLALLRNLPSSLPYAVSRYRSTAMRQRIRQLADAAELIVCDFLAAAINVPSDIAARSVLFQHNVEAMIWERHARVPQPYVRSMYMAEQWRRMRSIERRECRRFSRVIAVSDIDANFFRTQYGVDSVTSVATGVDLEYFSPPPGNQSRNSSDLVFVGSMDWMPNEDGMTWFLVEILPRLRQLVPESHVTIVGRSPSRALTKLAASIPGVEVTGTVPDVRPYLARASLSIVPLRIGGGTRLKIFEAMAMGAPVVSTSVGAEGLGLEPGRHFAAADEPEEFAGTVAHLLQQPSIAGALASNASSFVKAHCGWDSVAEEFVKNCTETRS